MQIELTDTDIPEIRDAISALLIAHTEQALGLSGGRQEIAVLLRGDDGEVEGGMWGNIRFRWLQLEFAYLPPLRRGGGEGAAMLGAMEAEAAARGCLGVRASTFSFQAPGFYLRQGYTEYGRLEGHPPGHQDLAFYKKDGLGDGDTGMAVQGDPDPAARLRLRELLLGHNAEQAGPPDFQPLAVVLRNDAGGIEGGMVGYTGRSWLHTERFALSPEWRGQGFGQKILTAAHAAAQARGVIGAKLSTGSYQARPFYERLGYRVYGTLADYLPGGHARYLMAQRFVD